MAKSGEILVINANKISKMTGYSSEEVAVVKNNVAKNVTDTELAYFLNVCKSVNLNPFVKEIWCYKDHRKNLLVFAGRDGHRTYAQRNPAFNGMRSSEVCEHDEFSIDIANNKITHVVGLQERGAIKGAYCIVFRKDGEPSIAHVAFKAYDRGIKTGSSKNAWNTHPAAMIKKVAEINALKAAFGMAGVQSEFDFEVKNEVAIPIDTVEAKVVDNLEDTKREVWAILKTMDKESREQFTTMIKEHGEAGTLTVEILDNIKKELQNPTEKKDVETKDPKA